MIIQYLCLKFTVGDSIHPIVFDLLFNQVEILPNNATSTASDPKALLSSEKQIVIY